MNQSGKGDSPRPFSVNINKFKENFEKIFRKKSNSKKPCPECLGSGKVAHDNAKGSFDDVCPACSGKGSVT